MTPENFEGDLPPALHVPGPGGERVIAAIEQFDPEFSPDSIR